MVCPNCRKLISKNSSECLFCGYKNPGGFNLGSISHKLFGPNFNVTNSIITFSAGLYVLSLLLDLSAIFEVRGMFGLLAPSSLSIYKLGATGTLALQYGRWWSVVTAIFLHGGIVHIFFNMLWIRQIGPTVEEFYGTPRYLIIYFVSGAVGFVASILGGHALTIGASGSIFGLLGALVFYGKTRGGYFGEAIYKQTGTWALVLFAFGFIMSGVDNFAHAGGFAGGYLVALLINFSERRPERLWHRVLALGLGIFTILAFVLNFLTMASIY
jgi:rhomboid protease GluP